MKNTDQNRYDSLVCFLDRVSKPLSTAVRGIDSDCKDRLQEIRLRAGQVVTFLLGNKEMYLTENFSLTRNINQGICIEKEELERIFNGVSENSIYAYQDEIKNGYITIKGGHRVGIAGKIVLESGSNGSVIKHIKDISSLNIRVAGQILNCGLKVLPHIIKGDSDIYNTLIVSPPGCGKTTLLRDLTRLLSDGVRSEGVLFKGVNVGVVDERSEIASCFKGVPQNDVGSRTDVLDGCPKVLGMMMLLRSMAPKIIVTDEIGGRGDGEAVRSLANAGVRLLTTTHGYCSHEKNTLGGELDIRKEARELVEEGMFQRIVVLDSSFGFSVQLPPTPLHASASVQLPPTPLHAKS